MQQLKAPLCKFRDMVLKRISPQWSTAEQLKPLEIGLVTASDPGREVNESQNAH
jgi:hypothetical protein